jgi:hypothetical protein
MEFDSKEKILSYLKKAKAYSHIKRYPRYEPVVSMVMDETQWLPPHATLAFRIQKFIAEVESNPLCPICGDDRGLQAEGNSYKETCGDALCEKTKRNNESITTSQEKYGVDYPNQNPDMYQKVRDGCIKKYGVSSYTKTEEYRIHCKNNPPSKELIARRRDGVIKAFAERKDEIIESRRKGTMEKYGVTNTSKIPEVMQRVMKTQKERYGSAYLASDECKLDRVNAFGVENYFQTEEFKENLKKKNLLEINTEHHLQSPYAFEKLSDSDWLMGEYETRTIVSIADEIDTTPSTVWRYLEKYGVTESAHGNDKVSQAERDIIEFIESYGFVTVSSDRATIAPYELDIIIPDKKVAIEFNGIFWHSEKFRDRDFHQKKSLMCMEQGILLIHIWEDDWCDSSKRAIIKNKILNKLGIGDRVFARKCTIHHPSPEEVRLFYNTNHVQGFVRATTHIGLCYNGAMVACMSLLKKSDGVWDLNRFASSMSVVGGFSKIMKNFQRNNEWSSIFTFAHLDYSHGKLYESTGFEKTKITSPGMWYTMGSTRLRRERFMKHKLHVMLKNYDQSLTEKQNMNNHGYMQLHDAGSIRYEMKNPHIV